MTLTRRTFLYGSFGAGAALLSAAARRTRHRKRPFGR